jgi:SAM-dependent methyltransferase
MFSNFPATSMPSRDWWAALWPDPSGVLRSLGVGPAIAVLDLCCGDGYFTAPLAKIAGARVYALDLDPAMIEQARAEADRRGVSVLKWITADAVQLTEFVFEQVDFVLLADTFHGVPDQSCLVNAVAKALKPEGLFAIVNWRPLPRERTTVFDQPRGPPSDMRMAPETVQAVVEPAGFHLARLVNLPPYHYGAVFERKTEGAGSTIAAGRAEGL